MTKLDSNAAWKDATRLVEVNREVLLVLAGVFFLLPSLAMAVLLGEPQVEPGMDPQAMRAAMMAFYGENWAPLLALIVLQFIGVLALLTLMRDRTRPTVAQAIVAGARGSLSYFAVYAMYGIGLGLIGGLIITLAALIAPALAVVAVFVLIGAFLYVTFRLMLVGPAIAVEGMLNPVSAIRRSWQLTKGNFWRLFGFVVLLLLLFGIILAIAMLIVGTILALVSSGETQRVVSALFSSTLSAVAAVYFTAVIAAIHRQLAGPTSREVAATFD